MHSFNGMQRGGAVIDAGRFEVKTGTSLTSNHAFSQARFTAKGVKWIGGLWVEHLTKKGMP